MDEQDRLKDIEDKMRARVEEHRKKRKEEQPAPQRPTPSLPERLRGIRRTTADRQAMVDLYRAYDLEAIDRLMAEDFELRRYFPDKDLIYPTIYCETLEEYFQPHVEYLDLSDTTKQRLMEQLRQQAEEMAELRPGSGEFGVHWPGRGCYLNGWLFAYGRAPDARAALADPGLLPYILATAAHEKLGHGFVTEFTAAGLEKKELQLWRHEIGNRFGIQIVDSPQATLLHEKWSILFHTSQHAEEGWAMWIQNYMLRRLRELATEGEHIDFGRARRDYSLDDTLDALEKIEFKHQDQDLRELAHWYRESVQRIFLQPQIDLQTLHQAALTLQEYGPRLAQPMGELLGQPPSYVVGSLLCRRLEEVLGANCVPFAVVIACNLSYNLGEIANADLARLVHDDPRLNIDSRLVQLTRLEVDTKDDIAELAQAAREALNLSPPAELAAL
ncbi:MAG TPA: hypothetical protein VM537_07565 [Anaerolineae bacterium]|nr:hypothetical protein [Anaerolineae bacterium]